jgi:hypothetical protein
MDEENYIYIYIYLSIMKYYSAIKENETLPFVRKWMELEVMLSERSQAQKAMFSLICGIYT